MLIRFVFFGGLVVLAASGNIGNYGCAVALGEHQPQHQVVDANGEPIPGAEIRILKYQFPAPKADEALDLIKCDRHGRFDYPTTVPKGSFYIEVSAEGFLADRWIGNNSAHLRSETGLKPDTLTIHRSVTLGGTVIGIDGKPAKDVPLSIYYFNDRRSVTNAFRTKSADDGSFVFKDLPPGELFVQYSPHTRETLPDSTKGVTLAVRHVHAEDGKTVDDIELDLRKSKCVVAGRLLDENEKPIAGASVRITITQAAHRLDLSARAKTAEDGTFRVEGLPPQLFTVTVTAGRQSACSTPINVRLRENEVQSIDLYGFYTGDVEKKDLKLNWKDRGDGVFAATVLRPQKKTYAIGETVRLVVVVRNDSKERRSFVYASGNIDMIFEHPVLEKQRLNYDYFTGIARYCKYRLEPGEQIELSGAHTFAIQASGSQAARPTGAHLGVRVLPGESYAVHCKLGGSEDKPWLSGKTKLNVKE